MAEHLGTFSHHTVARRGSSVAVLWQSLVGMQGRAGNSLPSCMLLPILPSMVSTELVSNFFLVARAKVCVLTSCAVVWWFAPSVCLPWPALLDWWQERSADVAAPVWSKDLGCPWMSQASLSSSLPSTAQQELGVDTRSTGCVGLWLVGS